MHSIKRVGGALDLEAMHAAIDDGDIDARLGMRKAEFVDNERVVAAMKRAERLAMERGADFGVGRMGHGTSTGRGLGRPGWSH
jgi:hypothetical protein